jgi:hypothetical protein
MKKTTTGEETQILELSRKLTQLMIAGDTKEMSRILDPNFALTHITGYVQPVSEWFAEIEKESMKYYSAKELAHSIKVDGDKAEFVQQNLLDARIWGSRNTWRLQMKMDLEKHDGQWMILRSVASVF